VLSCDSKDEHQYILNGELIPVAKEIRDPGVVITPELDCSAYITQPIQSETLISNTINRVSWLKGLNFILNSDLVLPKCTYDTLKRLSGTIEAFTSRRTEPNAHPYRRPTR